jgi:digeranylgeranylglycerophospholipid reductase
MKTAYDVTIIGAGPAGLMAAITAARDGLNVLLVERKSGISRVQRSCCSSLIMEPDTHGETVTLADNRIHFPHTGFSVPYTGPSIPLELAIRFSPGGNKLVFTQKGQPLAVSISKENLLGGLVREAEQAGVTIFNNTLALKAENAEGRVRVALRQPGRDFEVVSETAIVADGVNSRMVENLGLNQQRKFFARFHVVTCYMENMSCEYPPSWMVFVGKGHTPSGMGQIYVLPKPRSDGSVVHEVTYGCPVIDESRIKGDLEWFMREGTFSPWFRQARCVRTLSAVLRFHTPLAEPVSGRILIAGDAASFIEVYMQGALMYGFRAAQAVAGFLKSGAGFDAYTRFWKDTYGYNQPGAIEAATQAFGLHVLTDDEIDYLFSLTDAEQHPGFVNEFSDRENLMRAICAHMREIQRDRPELAARIQNLGSMSVEELLQVT